MSSHNGLPRSIVKSFVFFKHFCDCSVKTELIYRNDYAKNSLNRFQIGTIVYRQFSMAFAFEPHVEEERPELCRIGSRKGFQKSDDGCCSQRRSANQRRSHGICERIGLIRDSNASRRYAGRSFTQKTLQRSRIFLRVDQWPETTTHQRWQTDKMQHGEQRTDRCPWFIDKLFKFSQTYISNISIARSSSCYIASRINKKWD